VIGSPKPISGNSPAPKPGSGAASTAFNLQGFGSQNTITEATEQNWNGSLEANYNYPLTPDLQGSPVAFYADVCAGAATEDFNRLTAFSYSAVLVSQWMIPLPRE